jgi:hypothetical protein
LAPNGVGVGAFHQLRRLRVIGGMDHVVQHSISLFYGVDRLRHGEPVAKLCLEAPAHLPPHAVPRFIPATLRQSLRPHQACHLS